MAYRNKTYVAFDGDNDIHYYRLMCAWKQNDNTPFSFFNAHDINYSYDTSLEETIKRQLMERLRNSKLFVLLIGDKTRYLYKFVRWEIEQALKREMPIICVNLNGVRGFDEINCPPILHDKLAVHISFNTAILQYALENWPESHEKHKSENKLMPYKFKSIVYTEVGL